MSEYVGTVRQGEAPVLFVSFPCSSGSAYIDGVPSVTVRDYYNGTAIRTGTPITGSSGTVLSAEPQAWFRFDTVSPGTIPPGWVSLCFAGSVVGSDGIARLEEPKIDVLITPVWEG